MSGIDRNEDFGNVKVSQLFRQEVIDEHNNQGYGQIRLLQPLATWIISAGAVFVTIGLIAFITLASVTRKAHVGGITVPSAGTLSISSMSGGVLIKCMVAEGQVVSAGQKLFELSTERLGGGGEVSLLVDQQLGIRRGAIESEQRIRISQVKEKRVMLDARIANIRSSIEQIDQEIVFAQRRKALADKAVEQYEKLEKQGFAAQAQTQQKLEESLDSGTRLSSLIRNRLQLRADALMADAERSELANSLAADLSQLNRSLATIAQEAAENQSRKSNIIVASQPGTITGITYKTGQAVNSGQVIATMIPLNVAKDGLRTAALEIHLYVPSRTAGFIASGQIVQIRYQAFPYQKFGLGSGVVEDISTTPFAPSELPSNLASTILARAQQNSPATAYVESLYRVRVRLLQEHISAYGMPIPLKPGMTLDADIIQDRRKIFEWIADPIIAISIR